MKNSQQQSQTTTIDKLLNQHHQQSQHQDDKQRYSLSTDVVSQIKSDNLSQIQHFDTHNQPNWQYNQDISFIYPNLQYKNYHLINNQFQWQTSPSFTYNIQYPQLQYHDYYQQYNQYYNYQNMQNCQQIQHLPKMVEYKSEVIQPNKNNQKRQYYQHNTKYNRFSGGFDKKIIGVNKNNKSSSSSSSKQSHYHYRQSTIQEGTDHQIQGQVNQIEKQMRQLNIANPQKINKLLFNLQPYFNKYKIDKWRKQRIIKFLTNRVSTIQNINLVIQTICQLQIQSPQYFTSKTINLFKILKQIIKNNFNIASIKQKLNKKLYLFQKKQYHDTKFQQKYPNPYHIQFLQLQDLFKLNLNNTVFFVDGNNIMPKQKKFRLYFQNHDERIKAEGQIRLAWLFGQAVQCQMFFDTWYGLDMYNAIKSNILSKKQQKMLDKMTIHFAQKHLNPSNTADMKIINRIKQVKQANQYKNYDIILVSADKQLSQLCYQIMPIKKTSGIFIYKYCKKIIRSKYYDKPQMKGIIKRIFTY